MKEDTKKTGNTKYIDYLNEDEPIPSQNWVCLSFLSPEGIRNCSVRGLKIRGVFSSREEADKRCEELQITDPDFDVFVGEVGKWLPWDPDPNDVKDQIYQEKELNDLMKGYKDNLEKAKRMQQQRKTDMIHNAAEQEQTKVDKMRSRMRKKLEEKKQKQRMDQLAQKQLTHKANLIDEEVPETSEDSYISSGSGKRRRNRRKKNKQNQQNKSVKQIELSKEDEELKEQEELAKAERDRLSTYKQAINEKEQNLESIDDKLARIQQLYSKFNSSK